MRSHDLRGNAVLVALPVAVAMGITGCETDTDSVSEEEPPLEEELPATAPEADLEGR